jgi:xanthine dehydrogenase molybdopterin-binding subunit B
MLHRDFHRSSHGHARIIKIDMYKPQAPPGVLADGKVLFQNQEIAFVVATDRYIAADTTDLVEVEYEALPVSSSHSRRWTPTPRPYARTSETRSRGRLGRAGIRTIPSPGPLGTAT